MENNEKKTFINHFVATVIATRSALRTEKNWGTIHNQIDFKSATEFANREAEEVWNNLTEITNGK